MYVVGPNVGGISILAVVVFGLGKNFLFNLL